MNNARFLLLESTGKWSAPLRRGLSRFRVSTTIVPSEQELARNLKDAPASIVALECDRGNFDQTVDLVVRLTRRYPRLRCLTLVDRSISNNHIVLREAGAIHVQSNIRDLRAACRVIATHIARTPRPDQSLTQQILSELPWS